MNIYHPIKRIFLLVSFGGPNTVPVAMPVAPPMAPPVATSPQVDVDQCQSHWRICFLYIYTHTYIQ